MRYHTTLFSFLFILFLCIQSAGSVLIANDVYFHTGHITLTFKTETEECYMIQVDSQSHKDYGLGYPVTYSFKIPPDTVQCFYKYYKYSDWKELPIETTDKFNGINAVRFDHKKGRAYVSIGFGDTDNIFLKFTDNEGNIKDVTFKEICKYYDNRRMVVAISGDDWNNLRHEDFKKFCQTLRNHNMWATVGVITQWNNDMVNWDIIQEEIDKGNVEIASHSRHHKPPSESWEEIYGSKEDIIKNLRLSWQYRYGNQQYVPCFLEPGSKHTNLQRENLAKAKYLCERTGLWKGDYAFTQWESNRLYKRERTRAFIEKKTIKELNSLFDVCYQNKMVYHASCHPKWINWDDPNNVFKKHIEYIAKHSNIWYVGMGAMYMYHYIQERGKVKVQKIELPTKTFEFTSISLTKNGIAFQCKSTTQIIRTDKDSTIKIFTWNPDIEDINATIFEWHVIHSCGNVLYEILNLKAKAEYDIFVDDIYETTIITDDVGTFRWKENKEAPYKFAVKYRGAI